ncbi:MAG: hypothetical protein U1E05_06790, partial [Patescibacteria group bacterium]|nr:hypothetical protein [Patescibacteria group bacterium]
MTTELDSGPAADARPRRFALLRFWRGGIDFLPPEAEARGFRRLRLRIGATILRQTCEQSRFRLGLVIVLSILLWGALF